MDNNVSQRNLAHAPAGQAATGPQIDHVHSEVSCAMLCPGLYCTLESFADPRHELSAMPVPHAHGCCRCWQSKTQDPRGHEAYGGCMQLTSKAVRHGHSTFLEHVKAAAMIFVTYVQAHDHTTKLCNEKLLLADIVAMLSMWLCICVHMYMLHAFMKLFLSQCKLCVPLYT